MLVDHERNAMAFSLAAARKLRDLNLDIFRGYSQKEIQAFTDDLLKSHEPIFSGIPIPAFSSNDRKRERRIAFKNEEHIQK